MAMTEPEKKIAALEKALAVADHRETASAQEISLLRQSVAASEKELAVLKQQVTDLIKDRDERRLKQWQVTLAIVVAGLAVIGSLVASVFLAVVGLKK